MCLDVPVAGTSLRVAEQVLVHAASAEGRSIKWRPAVVVGPASAALGASYVRVQLHKTSKRRLDVPLTCVQAPPRCFQPGDLVRRTCQNLAEEDATARRAASCPVWVLKLQSLCWSKRLCFSHFARLDENGLCADLLLAALKYSAALLCCASFVVAGFRAVNTSYQ